jgi:2-polyprenyl-3-methyl-5-hydroxy-6-metoxy-1,4-benzoquinol methylase
MTDNYSEYLHRSKDYYNRRFGREATAGYAPQAEERLRWGCIRKAVLQHPAAAAGKAEILDFGCGRGWMSALLAECGNVTGADLSNEAIEQARSRYPGIEFVCIDASDDLHDTLHRRFDVVVSSEVIEHVLKQEDYMQNTISVLKPGGLLVLTTPNGRWIDHFYYRGRSSWAQPYELWLTAGQLRGIARGALDGLTIRSFNAQWVFDLPSFGWPHFLGNRFLRAFLTLTGLKTAYLRLLERKGYGINLLFVGRKRGD